MPTDIDIETHTFGPDSSPEQVEALRQRVSLYQGDIVVYREIETANAFSFGICYERIEELVAEHGSRLLIVDVRAGGRPDAALRRLIQERVEQLQDRVLKIGVVVSANPLVKVAARFLAAVVPVEFKAYGSIEEAAEAMRNAIR